MKYRSEDKDGGEILNRKIRFTLITIIVFSLLLLFNSNGSAEDQFAINQINNNQCTETVSEVQTDIINETETITETVREPVEQLNANGNIKDPSPIPMQETCESTVRITFTEIREVCGIIYVTETVTVTEPVTEPEVSTVSSANTQDGTECEKSSIIGPSDISISSETELNETVISWQVEGNYAYSYEIRQNGSIIEADRFLYTNLTVSLEGLTPGDYEYELLIYDPHDNLVDSDIVKVAVSINRNNEVLSLNIDNSQIIFAVISLAGVGGAVYYFSTMSLGYSKLDKFVINDKIDQIISPVFNYKSSLVYMFLTQEKINASDDQVDKLLKRDIPPELFDLKFLFNPVRLSIVKLLHESVELESVELRLLTGVSKNDFSNHLKALKEKNYVHSTQKFINGSLCQILSLEPVGMREYENLKEVLIEFLDATPNIEAYLEYSEKIKKGINDESLVSNSISDLDLLEE